MITVQFRAITTIKQLPKSNTTDVELGNKITAFNSSFFYVDRKAKITVPQCLCEEILDRTRTVSEF